MKKPKVIITRRLQDRVEKRMKELFNVELSSAEYPISKQELLSAVKDADGVPNFEFIKSALDIFLSVPEVVVTDKSTLPLSPSVCVK